MRFDIKEINKRETIKLWSILYDKYSDFVNAYASEDSPLRRYWQNMIEPEVMRLCGDAWGENPRLPTHPVGHALMKKNGLL